MARPPTSSTTPTLDAAQDAGFPVGGEPLSVDLADTIVTAVLPRFDLLADDVACSRFWALQHGRLPDGWEVPSLSATRELRDAIRQLFDEAHAGVELDDRSLAIVNRASATVTTALVGARAGAVLERVERLSAADPTDLALAAAARSAIEILTDPADAARIRRCANPGCSMLFFNGDARRRWCTPNICGNRARVARHYHRHRSDQPEDRSR